MADLRPASGAAARIEARVDVAAVRHNVLVLRAATAPGAAVMAVVKADGYGHGALPVARAALAGGRHLARASAPSTRRWSCARRASTAPLLSWLHLPDEDFAPRRRGGDRPVRRRPRAHLAAVCDGACRAGRPARLHLKIDTGLSRNGAAAADWPDAASTPRRRPQADGDVEVVAVWSHLAHADDPGHPMHRRPGRPAERGVAGRVDARPRADPAPGQLRGHADPARPALRPRPPRDRGLRPRPAGTPGRGRARCARR